MTKEISGATAFPFDVQVHIVTNEARMRQCMQVLVGRSQWFAVEPYSDDVWHIFTKAGEMPRFTQAEIDNAEGWFKFNGDSAIEALSELSEEARKIDDHMCSEEREDGPQPPNGDDYNELFSLVAHACGFPVSSN